MLLIHHPIPGVDEITAITILSEIGDIHNFNSSKQLVAYAGIDPSVHQSGSYTARNSKFLSVVHLTYEKLFTRPL